MSDSAAAITTAASADCGRSARSELRNTRRMTTSPAPTRFVTWVLAPDCSATAVRDPLVEIANPWKKPAATLAAPMPIISWFGCSSSPRRAAKADAVAMVSVSDTSTMPTAARTNGPTSPTDGARERRARDALRQDPTVAIPWSARPSAADRIVAPATATSTAGIRRVIRGSRSSTSERADTDRERGTLRAIEVLDELADLVTEAVGVGREPEELRELADDDRDGEPVHVADLHFTREQVGDETELGDTEGDLDEADEQGQHPREHDGAAWVVGHEQRQRWRRR